MKKFKYAVIYICTHTHTKLRRGCNEIHVKLRSHRYIKFVDPALKDEHRLMVFENRLPRRMFGRNEQDVRGACSSLHNKGFEQIF
jgi:hypothetical protein